MVEPNCNLVELCCHKIQLCCHKKNNNINIVPQQVFSRPDVRTSVTSTRFKVKVKVTELLKLRKLHFPTSISSGVLAWSSKLTVDGDSMGPGLQLVRARFLNFLLGKLSREFKLRPMSIFHEIQMAIFR